MQDISNFQITFCFILYWALLIDNVTFQISLLYNDTKVTVIIIRNFINYWIHTSFLHVLHGVHWSVKWT